MEGENKNPDNSKKQDPKMLEGSSSKGELLSTLKEEMKQKEEELRQRQNDLRSRLEELRQSAGSEVCEETLEKKLADYEVQAYALLKDKEEYQIKLCRLINDSMERLSEAISLLPSQVGTSSSLEKVAAKPEAFSGNKQGKAIMQENDPEIFKKHKQEFVLFSSRNEEGPASEDSLKKWKESMKQEEEQMRVYHSNFCAKVEELGRTGGSREALLREIVDFQEKFSVFQNASKNYTHELQCSIDDSLGRLKDIQRILKSEKSSSDKKPEASVLGNMKDEAMQTKDLLKHHKRLREFDLNSTPNDGPLDDFSKKVKADCSGEKEVGMDVKALHQEEYTSAAGVDIKQKSNVGESMQKKMNQSEDEAIQTKDLLKHHKRLREFDLNSTPNDGPLDDFSKKVKADCSGEKVGMDVTALHQEEYTSAAGVDIKEESNVGESMKKKMNQSEDKPENLGAAKMIKEEPDE